MYSNFKYIFIEFTGLNENVFFKLIILFIKVMQSFTTQRSSHGQINSLHNHPRTKGSTEWIHQPKWPIPE